MTRALVRFTASRARRLALIAATLLLPLALSACLATEKAVVVVDPPADSVTFWPPDLRYARYGDTLHARIHGLKRRMSCAVPLVVSWNFRSDTTNHQFFRARSQFEIPAGASCPRDLAGLDTSFRIRPYTNTGKNLYLETPDGVVTDSVLFIAATPPDRASLTVIRHPVSADSTTSGRFTFRDSTASRAVRSVRAASLAACEIMQIAVFDRQGDTLLVKVRIIRSSDMPASVFPPCAAARADSIAVHPNIYKAFP